MIGLVRQAAGAIVIVLTTWAIRGFIHATPSRPLPACVCGCPASAHEHFRTGLDCGACGAEACPAYERTTEFEQREHVRAVAEAEAVETRARVIHQYRHRAGTAGTCGACLDQAEAELADDGREVPITVSLQDLGVDSLDAYQARRDAALGRVPLH